MILNLKKNWNIVPGLRKKISGALAKDFELIEVIKQELINGKNDEKRIAEESLTYLGLFYPSALVRHEAIFTLGEYGCQAYSFLRRSALEDPNPVVRHEACLAMSTESQQGAVNYNRPMLEYIAKHDSDEMVKETALVSSNRISMRIDKKNNNSTP